MFESFDKVMETLSGPDTGAKVWLIVGFAGTLTFFSRFMVQWIASERRKRSVIPVAFWYLSLVGTLLLLAYAIHTKELVYILAFAPNFLVYIRNLWLTYRPGTVTAAK